MIAGNISNPFSPFGFYRTPRLIFGAGVIRELGKTASAFGGSAIVVMGGSSFRSSRQYLDVITSLSNARVSIHEVTIDTEPSPDLVDAVVANHAGYVISVVIGIGGGSVLDAAKAIAAMLPLKQPILPYLEGVGTQKHPGTTLPVIAVPTTAGTGSEASANAVISAIGPGGFKRSLRHENFTPAVALIDPELAITCPPSVTAACGMDAFTQLLESYVSTKATPITDALALDAMRLSAPALPIAVHDGTNITARSAMAYAAFISGITLANAGLGAVHGLASIIGGMAPVPHGVVCGALLGPVTRVTIEKLNRQNPRHPALAKYAMAARCSDDDAYDQNTACEKLVTMIDRWKTVFGIPDLSAYRVDMKAIAQRWTSSDSKNNPVGLDEEDVGRVLMGGIMG